MNENMKIEKKGLVPRLRFPEFQEAGEWTEKELAQVCEFNPPARSLPESFVYIDLESVEEGKLLQKRTISRTGAPSRAQRLLVRRDIIFQMVRPYQKNNYFFMPDDDIEYVASTGYAQLRAHESNTYLFQYLHHDGFVNRVLEKCTGSNYPAINSSSLSTILVEIPEPKEQQKIADCLSSLDALIAAHADKLDALKTHKKGLMQQLFPREGETVPRLRFPEFREAGEWEPKLLGSLCGKISSGKDSTDAEGDYALYGSTGIIGKTTTASFDGVYILVARVGANAGLLTKAKGSFGVTDNTLVLHLTNTETTDFIFYWLDRIGLNKFVFGSGQPLVTGKQLKDLELRFPSFDEKQKIADCLSSLDNLITAHTKKLEALKTHKKGLMQQLFPNPEAL
jgi:type I restriction enzyme S subunit